MSARQEKSDSRTCLLTIKELAFLTGTTPRVIERLVSFEVVCPERVEPEPCFDPETVGWVQRAVRMHRHLGIAWSSVGFVMELIDRIEKLESAISGTGSDEDNSKRYGASSRE